MLENYMGRSFSFDQLTQLSFKLVDYPQVSSWLVTWDGISNLVINLIKAHMIKENYSYLIF